MDESKFQVFGSDGRIMIWRKPNEKLKLKFFDRLLNMVGLESWFGGVCRLMESAISTLLKATWIIFNILLF